MYPLPRKGAVRLVLLLVLALALGLRVAGLRWGLADSLHFFSLHPDEFRLVDPVWRSLSSGVVSPERYTYGCFSFDVLYAAGWVARELGWDLDPARLNLLARWITAFFGAATVYVVFHCAAALRDERTGLVAALLLALAPGHVEHSHFATVDVPAAFFIALALYCALRSVAAPGFRWAALGGAAAGLAASTKYPSGLVLLAVGVGVWVAPGAARWRRLGTAIGACALVFCGVCCFIFLDWETATQHIHYELFLHQQQGHGREFEATGNGWWYQVATNFPWLFTWPWTAAASAGTLLLARRGRRGAVLLSFALPMFVTLGASNVRFMRYALHLIPVLAIGAADLLSLPRRAWVRFAALAIVALPAAWATSKVVLGMAMDDPRDRAGAWMREHVPPGASVGLVAEPLFDLVGLVPFDGRQDESTNPASARNWFRRQVQRGNAPYEYVLCSRWDLDTLTRERPEYFLISELKWNANLRLDHEETLAFLAALEEGWQLEQRFDSFPPEERWIFGAALTPPDWLYPFPQVRVYKRR